MVVTSDRCKLIVAVALAVLALIAVALLGEREHITALLRWTGEQGPWAPLILAGAYVAAAVCVLPTLLLSICAGYLLGVTVGAATASTGSTLGALAAFAVGRRLLRNRVRLAMARRGSFRQLEQGVARGGFRIVLLSRLSPILPSNLLNYALAVTPVRFRDFALASWLGMFPMTLAYVYLGSTLAGLAELKQSDRPMHAWQLALYAGGLLATVAMVVLLSRLAREAFRGEVPPKAEVEIEHATAKSQ